MTRYICQTCNTEKEDTAFNIKWMKIDTRKCLDCLYPHRWDEIKKYLKEKGFKIKE